MRTREGLLALVAELEGDFRELQRIRALNRRAWERIATGSSDELDWAALGFTLHSMYGILENYFLRVSKFFENSLPAERWHKALVEKMAIEIPELRPALFLEERTRRLAMELLKFRHRFRNLYGEELDSQKTSEIQAAADEFGAAFEIEHLAFVEKLKSIGRNMP
jgi:hypothetical protein